MTEVAVLWLASIGCAIVALLGKSVSIGSVQIPEAAEKKARVGMAGVSVLGLGLGFMLFFRPDNGGQPVPVAETASPAAPAPRPASQPSGLPSSPSPSLSPFQTLPGTGATTEIASPPSAGPGAIVAAKPVYLSSLTGTVDGQDDIQAAAPETGSWTMNGINYSHSLGYTGDTNLCDDSQSVTYDFAGSYNYFTATVGVANVPGDSAGQGVGVDFEVDNGTGSQLGAKSAQYGQPGIVHVDIKGIKSITLVTSSSEGCIGDGTTEAVWGNAQVSSLASNFRIPDVLA